MVRATLAALRRFAEAEDGPTAVEYAVILALIVLVCFAAIQSVGNATVSKYQNIELKTAVN